MFATVLLGGAVRLTGSGLSMVDWQPLRGVIPPLDADGWRQAFDNYRQFPEFNLVNPDMTLAEFRFIFWMEYAHRLLGRLIGAAFLLPFLFFLAAGRVPRAAVGRLWALFFLGGMQGLLGWHMVKSGLADDPHVSHYRLALHFMLAVVIYAYLLRVLVGISRRPQSPERAAHDTPLRLTGGIALALILMMMASGALVAGTHAGHVYNTWPLMGGRWLPPQLLAMQPGWLNAFENLVAIQFIHRWLALAVLVAVIAFALRLIRARAATGNNRALIGYLLAALAVAQVALGIATLVLRVPPALASAHQAGAMLLLTVAVIALARHLPPLADPEPTRANEKRHA